MKEFFQQYPDAKPLYKVGDQYFLNHCKEQAEMVAAVTGETLEIVTGEMPNDEIVHLGVVEQPKEEQPKGKKKGSSNNQKVKSNATE